MMNTIKRQSQRVTPAVPCVGGQDLWQHLLAQVQSPLPCSGGTTVGGCAHICHQSFLTVSLHQVCANIYFLP